MQLLTRQYSLCFRLQKLQFAQLVCNEVLDTQFGNDTVDSRAIEFIEEVNIEDVIGIENAIDIEVTNA
jgi:hypothetical protein